MSLRSFTDVWILLHCVLCFCWRRCDLFCRGAALNSTMWCYTLNILYQVLSLLAQTDVLIRKIWVSLESWYGESVTGGYCVRTAFYCRLGISPECVTVLFYWCLDIDFYSTSVITFVSRNCRCSSNLLEENAEAYLGTPRILKFMNCTGFLSVVSEYFDLWEGTVGSEFGIKLGLDMRQKVDLLWFLW